MPISEVSSSDYIAGCSPHSKLECFPVTIHPCLQYTQGMYSYNFFCVSVCNYNPSLCSSKEKNWNKQQPIPSALQSMSQENKTYKIEYKLLIFKFLYQNRRELM